ncbi:MAG: hypothetical protein ABSE56_10325 [Bryobacteraceae bacterium]|jgi:hypothetical protein
MPVTGETKKVLVALSVQLEVLAKGKLRKFVFGLKKTQENDLDKWSVSFELLDRASADAQFARAVFLDIDLDLKKVPVEAVQATADKGLNKPQVEYTLTAVASDADKLSQGKIQESRMKRTVSDLFAARNG